MLKKISFYIVIVLILSSCGYRPTAQLAKEELGKSIFVKTDIRASDPRNSVLVKDAVTKILSQRLDSNLVDNQFEAEIIMDLSIGSVSFGVLQYDKDGYNKLYKAKVNINVKYFDKEKSKTKSFTVSGEYDFAVGIGGEINDTHRFEAISKASDMAVTEILSRVAVASFE
ncbi:hypothetical protein CRU86_06745 [Aliarcobacter skirrowii]|uniref:LPS assembly lipoprotein LptE n=1 Tax=Aliarcobacter skirrowii TaxID=28200 RepID=UPI00100AB1E3|nr:LPS assembly lipoprotein LptE [Aliarcobacter skirrowii]RXJ76895.1 hypothetical protein CRU86_06745 [Aliarcobacter skirrowii]